MDNFIKEIANFFIFLQNKINVKDWFSCIGTSIYLYLNDLKKIKAKIKKGYCFNIEDKQQFRNMLDILEIKVKTNDDAKIQQRLNYWILLGVVERLDTNNYQFKEVNIDESNVLNIMINNGIYLMSNHDIKLNIPAIRILNGFFVYCIYLYFNKNIKNIIELCNDKTKIKLQESIQLQKSKIKLSIDETYYEFVEKILNNIISKEFIIFFINKVTNNNYSTSFKNNHNRITNNTKNNNPNNVNNDKIANINNEEINNINQAIDDLYNQKNKINKEKKIDHLAQEIIKILRNGFSEKVKSNHHSDLIINNFNSDIIVLHEAAHVLSVSRIKNIIIKLLENNKQEMKEKINEIFQYGCNEDNGIFIPFNYHKMFDKDLIKIDWDNKKFVINEKITDQTTIRTIKEVYGFNENNKFKPRKFEKIRIHNEKYELILSNIEKNIINNKK